jgi:hypothetical protein
MSEIRTLVRIVIRLTPRPEASRASEGYIQARLDRLPDRGRAAIPGVETFRTCIKGAGRTREEIVRTDKVRLVKTDLVRRLQECLDRVDRTRYNIEVIEDPDRLLSLRPVYCQHCGKKLAESFGPATGLHKKCAGCGELAAAWPQRRRRRRR